MAKLLALAMVTALLAVPDLARAQTKDHDALTASRFSITIDGVQKPKSKGLKSSSGKKGTVKKGSAKVKTKSATPK